MLRTLKNRFAIFWAWQTYIHTHIHKKTFFQFSKPRPSLIFVREFSFLLSIALFASSYHFSVLKSVENWKFRKIAVGVFFVAPDLNLSCIHYKYQLFQQFSHCFISLLINFQGPNRLPHRYPTPNELLSLQKVLRSPVYWALSISLLSLIGFVLPLDCLSNSLGINLFL